MAAKLQPCASHLQSRFAFLLIIAIGGLTLGRKYQYGSSS